MANNRKSSNVISFRAPESAVQRVAAGASSRHAETAALLARCRDLLREAIATSLIKYRSRANEELLAMADCAASAAGQQCYFSALNILTNRANLLADIFRDNYAQCFDSGLAALANGAASRDLSSDRMVEVDHDAFEQDLAVGKLASRVAYQCLRELTTLERRLAAALECRPIGDADNPLHPQLIFSVLAQAALETGTERSSALAILSAYERHIGAELKRVYAELDRLLADAGWLPGIATAVSHELPPGSQARSQEAAATAAESNGDTVRQACHASSHVPNPNDVSATRTAPPELPDDVFQRLLKAFAPSADVCAAVGTDEQNGAGDAREQLLACLDRLQGTSATSRPARRRDPGSAWLLRECARGEAMPYAGALDIKTIEIVALLFEAMFADSHLSPALIEELARLQIPLLKVALLDKTLFANAWHPARRLIDAIATAALGCPERGRQRLLVKIHAIIDSVVANFDRDISVFSAQTAELEDFLKQQLSRPVERVCHTAGRGCPRDSNELANLHADETLRGRLAGQSSPALIVDFITQHWSRVLVKIGMRSGAGSFEWEEALRLIDELVWSVQPKPDADERNRLVIMLPDLLKRLRAGLKYAGLETVWDTFFAQLVELHVKALHHQQTGAVLAPVFEAQRINDSAALDDYSMLLQRLPIGTWVEFSGPQAQRETLYLDWIDETRQQFLFTDRQGGQARSLTARALAGQFHAGTVRPLAESRLTERALTRLFARLRSADYSPDA